MSTQQIASSPSLTEREAAYLKALWQSALDIAGGDFTYIGEVGKEYTSEGKQAQGALFTSLREKGLVEFWPDFKQITFTDAGRALVEK